MAETEIDPVRQQEVERKALIDPPQNTMMRQTMATEVRGDDLAFLRGGGEMGALTRIHDWSSTALGNPGTWPQSLRSVLSACLNSPMLSAVLWGPDLLFLYNDAYTPSLAERHPYAFGRPVAEVWGDTWDRVSAPFYEAMATGLGFSQTDVPLPIMRYGQLEATWWDITATPIRGEDGTVVGLLNQGVETTERTRATAALRTTERRNRQILDSAIDFAIIATDLDGRVTRWNEGARRVLGWSEAEMLGHPVDCFFTPEDVAAGRVATEMRNALATGHGNDERWHQRRSGDRFWAVGEMTVLRDEHEAAIGFVKVLRDRTEHRRAEQRLRELNDTLEQEVQQRTSELNRLWQLSPDLLLVIDFAGIFRRVNPAWTALLGYEAAELIGHHVNEFVVPDHHAATTHAYSLAAEGGSPRIVNRYRHKDGTLRWISWVAAPADAVTYAIGRDITEERAREEALRNLEDFTRLALTSVGGVGVWTYDGGSDRFSCDAAIADLYGLDAERAAAGILRVEFLCNVHPEDRAKLASIMERATAQSGDVELEYRIRHPSGAIRWVLSRGHTYHEPDGTVRRTGVGIETTKQRQLEEQLRQSQKMEAVGQLTGGLAHDFNNLLTGISGSLDLLQKRVAQGRLGDLDRYLVAAQGASKRAAALTHRLLAFSRRQTLDPKPTNATKLVGGMADLIRRTVGPEITVETVDMAGLWTALVDPNQLENALLNLCINARDAMPNGGGLTVETANRWMDDRAARERDVSPGQYLSLSVTDTGTGMPPEVIARAFDPFFTTKPLGAGTGLGLSMIYGFARQSGGAVRIYSEVGQGTTVTIYLPRHHGSEDAQDVEIGRDMVPQAEAGEVVLVVDDEPTVRMLVGDVLGDLGYGALEAEDGPSGLKILQSAARVDLLITDVGLPGGMNGRQVADAARVLRPELKVLFITGYAENAVVGNGHLDPGMAVLTKPFAMDDLAAKIRALIEG